MTGAAFFAPDSRKVADAQRSGGPPGDAALEIDAFETASQEGGEGAAWGEGRAAHFPDRNLLAGGFGELAAVFGLEQLLAPGAIPDIAIHSCHQQGPRF